MKRILIPLCLVVGAQFTDAQRSYQFDSVNRLFNEGKELFVLKNYAGCMDKMEAYRGVSTDADLIQEADYLLACSAYEQNLPSSIDGLKSFLDQYPDTHHAAIVHYLIGSAYFSKEDYPRALHYFNQSNLDRLSLENQEAYTFRLAYALLKTDELDKARHYFTLLQNIGTTYNQDATYYLAYIDYATGKYDDALEQFIKLKNNPELAEKSKYYITQIYFIQHKYNKVIQTGEALLSDYPNNANNAEIYRIVGNSYYNQGNQSKALAMLSDYVESADKPLRSDLYILGVCQFNAGTYREAIGSLGQTVLLDDPVTQSAYLYLGQAYLKVGDKNNARMSFENAAKSNFDREMKETALYNYALLIHQTSFTGFGESVSLFESFLNDFPQSKYTDRVNSYLLEVYMTTKNYKAALTSINKIKRPSNKILEAKQGILFQLGTQAFTNIALPEAITLFDKAIALPAYNKEARNESYFWRAESNYRLGEYTKAVTDYRAYINNAGRATPAMHALALYNLGYSYFKLHQYSEALNFFKQYAAVESNQQATALADAYNRIGDCLFYNRQFALAEENYTRAAQLSPSAADYSVYQKAYVLGLQKDYKGKINILDKLITNYPNSQYVDDALFEKGRSYVLLENGTGAAKAFNQLAKNHPQSPLARKAGIQLGLLFFNDNQLDKAITSYKRVIDNYPGSQEAKTALQDLKSVYVELNDINTFATYANSLGGNVRFEVSEQDSLTYMAAEKQFMRGENGAARKSLVGYLQAFPQGAFSVDANYYLASIAFNNKEHAEALRLFDLVVASGHTKFTEDALARKAEIQYLQKEYAEALKTFKQLLAVAQTPSNQEAARLGLMRCAQLTANHAEAIEAATELLNAAKLSPEVKREAHYNRAKAYIALKQPNKAYADLKLLSSDTRTVHGAEAKYLLAQIFFNSKESDKAEKELMNFIENGTPHQYWLARGFILLADIYIAKQDDFQARQYLVSLQNNYKAKDDIAAMIEDRLGKLKK